LVAPGPAIAASVGQPSARAGRGRGGIDRGRADLRRYDLGVYAALIVLGALLGWASLFHAASMPALGPWDFSPGWFAGLSLALWWYLRGVLAMPLAERPPIWRGALYLAGVIALYAVLQTQFEYLAQHMFFLNRIQAVVLHVIAPVLVAISAPAAVLARGAPGWVQRFARGWGPRHLVAWLQHPVVAPALFVAVVAVWLIPAVHFRAMVDLKLYRVMNASMVLDGLSFWLLVLDRRPKPPASSSYAARMLMILAVLLPQTAIGAVLTLAPRGLYGFYAWCGRIYPSIGALEDQQLGGLIVWIPSFMMAAGALILVLNTMLRDPAPSLQS
jgi:putative membrane protein